MAICAGSGKSSQVNALRKVRPGQPGFAPTKAGAECTAESAKYPHPRAPDLVLWDVPGGGTDAHPAATYFSDKCLDLFDILVLCYDGRWSEVNTQIVEEAAKARRNFIIVYTKADVHVGNLVLDSAGLMTEAAAVAQLKRTVEADVAAHLAACGVPAHTVPLFLVDAFGIRDTSFKFDERAFLRALVTSAAARLGKAPAELWAAFPGASS